MTNIKVGAVADCVLHAGRFTSTSEVTVVRYFGCGLWTVRTAYGVELQASERELTIRPAVVAET